MNMNNFRGMLWVTGYQFRQLTRNPRLYMILICNFIFLSSIMADFRSFLAMYQLRATPFLFCFLFTHASVIFCFFSGIVFLYSNAPFFNRSQMFLVIRTGKLYWALGQILYLVLGSVLYFALLFAGTCIVLLPYIDLQMEWGSVWNTLARTDLGVMNGVALIVPADLLNRFTPMELTGWIILIGILNAVMIGLILFFCNLYFCREMGIGLSIFLIFLAYRLSFMPDFVHYIATVAWLNPGYLLSDPLYRGPDALQQILILAGFIAVLGVVCIYGILHKDIPEVKE